ncbi:SpoIIE family protein phosphatase [Chitinispirillales bacterium ANBcel5]|uniref:PP2C family protein-serine/threonine phosphatase n=1 Tax=Cellulosispirillum alkaliphilum TaxID=3039283 RepID=UPI002A55D890|nr:SpoIIE family protein phosphatase [Chitinispirillales bacterium ANBcel5]
MLNLFFSFDFLFPAVLTLTVAVVILSIFYRRYPLHLIYKSKLGLESMLDAVNDPLAVISSDYTVKRINKAYALLIGQPIKQSIGQKCYKLLRNRSDICEDCHLKETLSTQKSYFVEHSVHPDGHGAVSINFSTYAIPYERKTEFCVIEHIRDITTLEQLKLDLEKKNHSLANTTKRLEAAQENIHDELKLARRIQQGLLPPEIPSSKSLKLDVVCQPISEVGGDFYDFVTISEDKFGIFIGDASGHGLSSSLIGAIAKTSLDHHSKSKIDTSELLLRMNADLCRCIHTSHYLTCFWCIFDFKKNIVEFSRAGHPIPVVIRKDGTFEKLKCSGPFLGILDEPFLDKNYFEFKKGDRFYFFTDGIYDVFERQDRKLNVFGYDRFTELITEISSTPFEGVIGSIENSLSEYSLEDDYTLIVAEICA